MLVLASLLAIVALADSKPYYSIYLDGTQWIVKPGKDSTNVRHC